MVVCVEHDRVPHSILLYYCADHVLCAPPSLFIFVLQPNLLSTVKNVFYAKYMPISAYFSFDNTGNRYDPSAIVTDGEFDVAKYESYSPLFVSSTLAMAYGLAFAAFTSVLVHTFRKFPPL